jgi:hypothetical protein
MRVARDVACGVWASLRETWPSTEDEAGPWLGGFVWAFALHWVILILVTLAWYGGQR